MAASEGDDRACAGLRAGNPKFLQRAAIIEKELRKKQPSGGGGAAAPAGGASADPDLFLYDTKWLHNAQTTQFFELSHQEEQYAKAIKVGEHALEEVSESEPRLRSDICCVMAEHHMHLRELEQAQ